MKRHKITVPIRIPTLNTVYSSNNYYHKSRIKKEVEKEIAKMLMVSDLPDQFETPIAVVAISYTCNKRDVENCVMANKFFGDTLVDKGYIEDDSPEYVCFTGQIWKKAKDGRSSERTVYVIWEGVDDDIVIPY